MTVRSFHHAWKCAGCETMFDLETRVEQRDIDRATYPAPFIAAKKMALERAAAEEHARKGCPRPV